MDSLLCEIPYLRYRANRPVHYHKDPNEEAIRNRLRCIQRQCGADRRRGLAEVECHSCAKMSSEALYCRRIRNQPAYKISRNRFLDQSMAGVRDGMGLK